MNTESKLAKMNSILLTQLEDLSREGMTEEEFKQELERTKAMTSVGKILVESAKAETEFVKAGGMLDAGHSLIAPIKKQLPQ